MAAGDGAQTRLRRAFRSAFVGCYIRPHAAHNQATMAMGVVRALPRLGLDFEGESALNALHQRRQKNRGNLKAGAGRR